MKCLLNVVFLRDPPKVTVPPGAAREAMARLKASSLESIQT